MKSHVVPKSALARERVNEARQADGDEQRVSNDDNDPQLMGEAKNAMHDMFDMMANQSSDPLTLEEWVVRENHS